MTDPRLGEALARWGRGHKPRPGWENAVRARIVTPNAEKRGLAVWWVAAAAGLLVCVLGVFLWQSGQRVERARAEARAKASDLADYEQEIAALRRNQREQEAILDRYRSAATEEERRRIEVQIASKKREAAAIQQRADRARKKAGGRAKGQEIMVACDPHDPLCGL